MISVRDGQDRILAQIAAPLPSEQVSLTRALGRVLADEVRAPFDVPPDDNSAVDGYAVASADVPVEGTATLTVIADLPAGSVFSGTLASGQTVRIMTGAPMPRGADTVYPQEVVTRSGDHVGIGPLDKGANVRMRGEDVRTGTIVIARGTVLRPQEIGLIASLGGWQLPVHRRPRVALLSTGDEVAEPGGPRAPGQIYDANRFTLRGSIEQCGGDVVDLGIVPDVRDTLRARLLDASRVADVVVTSGGVSVGDYDLVKDVLGDLGGIDFWQVAMQPGRPLAFGRIGDAHFFGLPG
ncbi:MAG: molybdopterin molybdotransferase MoeA, partial [Candidatus Rokubacteria bacterium]|nr:molybdopterin molybdotransferase MoeA [Candidatus Rokubacteria bacterium]